MPDITLPEQIRTPDDIVRFFMFLDRVDRTSFHPDDPFFAEGEVQYSTRTGEPAYTPEEAQLRDRLMEQVWAVASAHNLDPSELAIWVTSPDPQPDRPAWVDRAIRTIGRSRKAWDPTEESPELGALPPARQVFQIGDLQFEVLLPRGAVTEIRITSRGSQDALVLRPQPRVQPVERTLQRALEDLYAMAQDPDRIRELMRMVKMPPEDAKIGEEMIQWAERHRPQIIGAMARIAPTVVPFQRVP